MKKKEGTKATKISEKVFLDPPCFCSGSTARYTVYSDRFVIVVSQLYSAYWKASIVRYKIVPNTIFFYAGVIGVHTHLTVLWFVRILHKIHFKKVAVVGKKLKKK